MSLTKEANGSPESMVLLTDGTPNPLLRSLEAMYPESSRVCPHSNKEAETDDQIGIVSAPTPFITGRPHTLFHNAKTYSSGAVGISLPNQYKTEITYPLKPLTDRLKITSYVPSSTG
jgi:hypothetical protein